MPEIVRRVQASFCLARPDPRYYNLWRHPISEEPTMKRFCTIALGAAVCLAGRILPTDPAGATAAAQTPAARKSTIAYVRSLQTKDGGFLPARPTPTSSQAPRPTLRATSSAVRALKYLGGEIPDREACARFVAACFDSKSGGFRDQPKAGTPDVFTTAVGLMAVSELGLPGETYHAPAVKFLAENTKGFDDIRIAVAGLERINQKSPRAAEWAKMVQQQWNPDGTAGKGNGTARATGSVAVAALRLGDKLKNRDQVLEALRDGQRNNGGWGKEGTPGSDLETTYRVMRALVMLNGRPTDAEGVRSFVAKCRNEDHGYGPAPGAPSTVGATYYASIVLHWLDRK